VPEVICWTLPPESSTHRSGPLGVSLRRPVTLPRAKMHMHMLMGCSASRSVLVVFLLGNVRSRCCRPRQSATHMHVQLIELMIMIKRL